MGGGEEWERIEEPTGKYMHMQHGRGCAALLTALTKDHDHAVVQCWREKTLWNLVQKKAEAEVNAYEEVVSERWPNRMVLGVG